MSEEPSYLFENVFYDPYVTIPSATVSQAGQPLARLIIPPIQTLIYKTQPATRIIPMIEAPLPSGQVTPAGVTTPVTPAREETGGIVLNLNLLGGAPPSEPQINPAQIPSQSLGTRIPTKPREVLEVLHMITAKKAGSKNEAFTLVELKQIAKNLHLPVLGNKDGIATSIRNYIIEFFNLPPQ